MNNDLISRSELKKAFEITQYNDYDDLKRTESLIDNAPTIETFTKDDMSSAYNEGYDCGNRETARQKGKKDAAAETKELINHLFELSFALDSQSAGKDFLSLRRTHYKNLEWIYKNGLNDDYYKFFFGRIDGGGK